MWIIPDGYAGYEYEPSESQIRYEAELYEESKRPLTTTEAAAALGVTKRAVQRAIRVGTLAATRQGRDWFVSAAAIEDYRRDHLRRYGRKAK